MRKNFVKWIAAALCLAMAAGCAAAGAEGALSSIYAAGRTLLLQTENVTLTGEAEFFLDGESFKKAEGTYIQSGTDSFQQIDLKGPDNEGTVHENGYAVMDLDGDVKIFEKHHGRDHGKTRYAVPQATILQENRMISLLADFGAAATEIFENALDGKIETAETEAGKKTAWKAEAEDVPAVVQSAVNMLWQAGVSRFFFPGYQEMEPARYAELNSFSTPTEGILFTTERIALKRMEAAAEQDEEGRITSLAGEAEILLYGETSGEHTLKVSFSVKAESYGSSSVRDNGAVMDRMGIRPQEEEPVPEIPEFKDTAVQRDITGDEEAVAYAQEIWKMDFLGAGDLSGFQWIVRPLENGHITVWAYNPEDVPLNYYYLETDETGWIYSLRNAASGVEQAADYWTEKMDGDGWDKLRVGLIYSCLDFAERVNPGNAGRIAEIREKNDPDHGLYSPGYGGALISGENVFLTFYSDPLNPDRTERTKTVFQIEPVVRVVLYDETIDPMEGGNG